MSFSRILPLGLLLALCTYTAIIILGFTTEVDGSSYYRVFNWQHYGGFVFVTACLLALRFYRKWYPYVLATTLLLGVVNVLQFTPDATSLSLGFGPLNVTLQPVSLAFLFLFYWPSRRRINHLLKQQLLPVPSPAQIESNRRHSIDGFKETFARKSDESLQQIVSERKLVAAAVLAAEELLSERNKAF